MQIEKNKVAKLEYELTDSEGEMIDSSKDGELLEYIHGLGHMIPGLERALEGKGAGDAFKLTVPPEDGYGERVEALVLVVPREKFERPDDLDVGMQVQLESPDGVRIVRVAAVEGDDVTLDANHPLAGMTLCFDVTIKEVREATEEELNHGHVHGEDGHEHED